MTPINFAATRRLERVLLAVALGACGAAQAQNAATPDENAVDTSGALKEIVVTATRHEESLSKVPESVSAYTQDDMDQKGMKDFTDIVRFTPGVSIDQTGTNAISIRGISSSGGAGTTGIYLDDTPIQMRSLGFNPTIRCRRHSIWIASRCCVARRARCSAPVPRAAPCAIF